MILLGYYLAMIGIADAARGLPRKPTRWAALGGLLLALGIAVVGVEASGVPPIVMLVPLVFTIAWVLSTPGGSATTRWPLLALIVSVVAVTLVSTTVVTASSPFEAWLLPQLPGFEYSPLAQLTAQPTGQLVLLVGCGLVLLETCNIVVRLVLASESGAARSNLSEDTSELKGGRIIGPLERLIVFGLAVAGQFAAIGGVLAAKGVVRFPELSRSVRKRKKGEPPSKDPEYFLIGSLTSWGLALLLALLFTR